MKSKANFNPYIDKIDLNFWRELCVKEGKLCHYKKGEYFLHRRETPKYFGFITSGAFKYTIIVFRSVEQPKTIRNIQT